MYKGLVLTDLDGTFLNPTGGINKANIDALKKLHDNGIARAVCTGRTLNSSREVVPPDLPFDYLVFSSGAGVSDFAKDNILCSHNLISEDIINLTKYFRSKNIDFSVHFPIPDNHYFYWFSGPKKSPDLVSRLHYLREYAIEGSDELINKLGYATQFLAIINDDCLYLIDEAKSRFKHLSFVRATSPLTPNYTWIEVFPDKVTKGTGAEWLCRHLGLARENTMSIGNDYNDIQMLEWSGTAFVMENSPEDLKKRFLVCPSNEKDGFAVAVDLWLNDHFKEKDK
jgi:Cof subfamily protein (haloacid dehalogenase superfamily)